VITASFYVKKWIGQNAWRAIHMASFGTFVAAALHGIFSGTDSSHPVVMGTYVASLAIVVLLMVIRIAQAAAPPARPARASGTRRAGAGATPSKVGEPAESTAS
jgi:DMSO/TMAO reductase YedYZ heme-binding membrane subunit